MRSLLGAIEYVDSRDILQIKVKRLPQYFVLTSKMQLWFWFAMVDGGKGKGDNMLDDDIIVLSSSQ